MNQPKEWTGIAFPMGFFIMVSNDGVIHFGERDPITKEIVERYELRNATEEEISRCVNFIKEIQNILKSGNASDNEINIILCGFFKLALKNEQEVKPDSEKVLKKFYKESSEAFAKDDKYDTTLRDIESGII